MVENETERLLKEMKAVGLVKEDGKGELYLSPSVITNIEAEEKKKGRQLNKKEFVDIVMPLVKDAFHEN